MKAKGFSDWRQPTIEELHGIYDQAQNVRGYHIKVVFILASAARGAAAAGWIRMRLDHLIVFNDVSLRRTLHSYFEYYHKSRTHLWLAKDSPEPRAIQPVEMGRVVAVPQVGGLHHLYEPRAT